MLNNTKLIHSFHSKYCDRNKLFMYVCYYTLSCLYAKKNGFNIVLHTDDLGLKLFKNMPYDDIIVSLNNIERPHHLFFAYPKFHVLELMSDNDIHIDGDVFLKSEKLHDILLFNDYDCIVQSTEQETNSGIKFNQSWIDARKTLSKIEYPEWAKRVNHLMYNTGIMGFKNEELKRTYINTYWEMSEKFKHQCIDIPSCPEIIIEQQFLLDLCENKGFTTKEVIPFKLVGKNANEYAKSIGYQHVIGMNAKMNGLTDCIKTIKQLDGNIIKQLLNVKKYITNI